MRVNQPERICTRPHYHGIISAMPTYPVNKMG
jgi:hypothetical protein